MDDDALVDLVEQVHGVRLTVEQVNKVDRFIERAAEYAVRTSPCQIIQLVSGQACCRCHTNFLN